MPVHGFLSIEEKRALVHEYIRLPYGSKGRFLLDQGVTAGAVRRWRAMLFADTLDYGLVPRSCAVSADDSAALKRLLAENQALREELERQQRTVDALGKAIEILHPNGASKNSGPDAPLPDQPGRQPR